ncbi:hypothetical protein HYC85_012780 [Camellia sinensis]|uniref:Uncharacterized protein n=1 Tax=Camellia sinensis TaxID=4442 RepID=A0A7J7HE30_CAMSI|nr:hypothetical protein HYC85_012780 [Camellia sinensis]
MKRNTGINHSIALLAHKIDTIIFTNNHEIIEGEKEFFFGLATAPAHVEGRLDDAWLQFAEESPCDQAESEHDLQSADAVLGSAAGNGGSQQASLPLTEAKRMVKRKKSIKIAMEAMVRGFNKYVEEEEPAPPEECHNKVAAWHNVPHPLALLFHVVFEIYKLKAECRMEIYC